MIWKCLFKHAWGKWIVKRESVYAPYGYVTRQMFKYFEERKCIRCGKVQRREC